MPRRADGIIPKLLSQTGAFTDTPRMIPARGLIPYELIQAFWSDGADKQRWISVPAARIRFNPVGEWSFPAGTVFVKTFELHGKRLETRLLVRDENGGVYGVVYKWRSDNTDADLIDTSLTEQIGSQSWYYPSRQDCLQCHNTGAGGVLGVKTRQMNDNQLRSWSRIGLFEPAIKDSELAALPRLAAMGDTARSLEDRARSYLDANCAQCHRPGGTVAYFDARFDTPLAQQQLVNGPVLIDQGIDHPSIISPHDIWRSIAYMRIDTNSDIRMPPLARQSIDQQGVALLGEWIRSLPGRDVLDPPTISPAGGSYDHALEITLKDDDPSAEIRYTLDGSVPGTSDAHYDRPIELTVPTVLRARAFKPGYTRSITTQEAFIIGPQ
jgi:uncharacterized repeat protein (TIGR03806 family)